MPSLWPPGQGPEPPERCGSENDSDEPEMPLQFIFPLHFPNESPGYASFSIIERVFCQDTAEASGKKRIPPVSGPIMNKSKELIGFAILPGAMVEKKAADDRIKATWKNIEWLFMLPGCVFCFDGVHGVFRESATGCKMQ
jgi:hypothetical protein